MIHIALYQPEIPPNTGNIIRLCANSGAQLHLIHPLGFKLEDKKLRRAGLDYHEFASIIHYPDEQAFIEANAERTIYGLTTKTTKRYTDVTFQDEDMLLFGPETRGLPVHLRQNGLTIPMHPGSRSLNLSNSVAIVLYEAIRQLSLL